jgi:hypothetical protein
LSLFHPKDVGHWLWLKIEKKKNWKEPEGQKV